MTTTLEIIQGPQALTSSRALLLYQLDQSFFPTPWTEESWIRLFEDHQRFLILIKNNQKIIGFSLFDLVREDQFAHLLKIVINPEFRNQKNGLALLKYSLETLEKENFKHFFLEVEESNLSAQKIYLECGFKKIHQKKDFYGQNRNALIMTKEI